jgi:2-hydroxycyclohexanecarboxyl-CoA dehydrogenase
MVPGDGPARRVVAPLPIVSRRVALVTGGGGGIGGAIARQLADAGCAVAVGDVVPDAAARAGHGAHALSLDVTDAASVSEAVAAAEAELGRIEILVNCAGWDELRPFLETDEEFWRRVIEVNYTGCLRVTHAVLPGMAERGFGRIVNVASDAARVGSTGEAVYAGAKGAVVAFTKTIAREFARSGITANAVCPGPTETPLLAGMAESSPDSARLLEGLARAVPMRRLGRPEDVAAAVGFLTSDAAAYITGQTLSVSGGLTMA